MASSTQTTTAAGGAPVEQFDAIIVGAGLSGLCQLYHLRQLGLKVRVYEVAISYYGRTYEEGKKINWKDGISALRCVFKYNFFR